MKTYFWAPKPTKICTKKLDEKATHLKICGISYGKRKPFRGKAKTLKGRAKYPKSNVKT